MVSFKVECLRKHITALYNPPICEVNQSYAGASNSKFAMSKISFVRILQDHMDTSSLLDKRAGLSVLSRIGIVDSSTSTKTRSRLVLT